jgi:pyruvate formate-lyase activating enzyme-like uncharacterized protein
MISDKLTFIEQNRREYSDAGASMNWITDEKAAAANRKRHGLLQSLSKTAKWRFSNTKLFTGDISPGCARCGEGTWSCLFVNGICNASCFYCPSEQKSKGVPSTNNLSFESPDDYRDYLSIFKIRGVSFSGGEPLLTFERILKFLKKIRKTDGNLSHIWMYTNGLLATEDKLKSLRDAGLDEIRFDISAHHYNTDKAQMAVGIIPLVTVEIPAIPEDLSQLKQVVKTLYDSGISFLNLHQLRSTPFNNAKLLTRKYTFLHGPKVTVLESELSALELMQYTIDTNLRLPVNYCSFIYKHEYQAAGARRRNAEMIKTGYEDVTQKGFIRRMGIAGASADIGKRIQDLTENNCDQASWHVQQGGDMLFFAASLWNDINFSGCRLVVSYVSTSMRSGVSYSNPFKEIRLNKHRKIVIEKKTELKTTIIEEDMIRSFGSLYINSDNPVIDTEKVFPDIDNYEHFTFGLLDYY